MKNQINPMENPNLVPLNCLGVLTFNNTGNAPVPSVQIVTESMPKGYWKTTGYVNGKPSCSDYSKDRAANIRAVKETLAAAGHYAPKDLAPVMSAKLPKRTAPTAELPKQDLRTPFIAA